MDYTKDYYRILAVSPDADVVVIRAAYKALMIKYHPDRNKSAEAPGIAKSLTEAKSILDDEVLRLEYDLYRLKGGRFWSDNRSRNTNKFPELRASRPAASSLNVSPADKSRTILGVGGLLMTLALMLFAVAIS